MATLRTSVSQLHLYCDRRMEYLLSWLACAGEYQNRVQGTEHRMCDFFDHQLRERRREAKS